jgi:lipopolysaccharide/colanic/teichoic acid biosynthesis glycosyltransferase
MRPSRSIDLAFGALGLALGAPLLLFAAIGIRLTSRGPVLYRAQRVGKDERPFVMFKFRTMHPEAGGALVTSAKDDRVFPFGGFLRRTKIDELPQVFNILRGDMSVVGPRPEAPAIVAEHYTDAEKETLRVRPGLTSPGTLWYFSHGEEAIDSGDTMGTYLPIMREKLKLDSEYVRNANLKTDLGLIGQTLVAIARKLARVPTPLPSTSRDIP